MEWYFIETLQNSHWVTGSAEDAEFFFLAQCVSQV